MNRHRALWIVPGLLAARFLFAGGSTLIAPSNALAAMSPFLVRVILCEGLGACGLLLPQALRMRPELPFLAALGLTVIMVGATLSSLSMGLVAAIPLVVGLLTALVAYGRRHLRTPPRGGRLAVTPA